MIRTNNKVALYARFSSDNQRTESIDAQIRAMREYCQKNKFIIVETYIDEAKSATTDKRPAFQQMIADSSKKTFNILLVHKLDRFARNRYDSAVYKRELKKNGVQVYSVLENLDNSPESIMMESVLEGMSEYYSQNLSREVMKGLKETAYQCMHTGGIPPLGYDVDPITRKLTINAHEADTVRIIFDMYSKGYGYSPILEELHQQGRLTKHGQIFRKNSLYSILTNPKYQGLYVFNRSSAKSITGTRNNHLYKNYEDIIAIEGGCPQIVDKETYDKVQERITENQHKGGKYVAKENYLLSGKVYCKECGRAMCGNARHSGRNKDYYVTYRCMSKRYACSNKEINKDYLERYVVSLLEKHIFNTKAMKRIVSLIESYVPTNDYCKESLEDELVHINDALKNVTDAIENGLLSDILVERLGQLEDEKKHLERKIIESIPKEIPETIDTKLILSEYTDLRNSHSSPAYKEFIKAFIERIDIGKYSVDITIKTGLDIYPELDKTISVRREEIYKQGKTA